MTAGGKPGVTFPAKVIGFTDSGHLVLEIKSEDLAHVQEYVKLEDEYVASLIEDKEIRATFPVKVIGFTDSGHLVLEVESADSAHVQEYVKSEDEYMVQLIPRRPKPD